MANPHLETFDLVTLGQTVTSDNSSFHDFLGETQSGGLCVAGLYGNGMEVPYTAPMGIGYFDGGLYDVWGTGVSQRFALTIYVRVDVQPVGDQFHFFWLSEASVAIVEPIISLAAMPDGTFSGKGLGFLEEGSVNYVVGQWYRLDFETARTSSSDGLLSGFDIYTGDTIDSKDTADRVGRGWGVKDFGYQEISEGWTVFGNHGFYPLKTAGQVTIDYLRTDAFKQAPQVNPIYTGPGFHEWDGTHTKKVAVLGEADGGVGIGDVEFLGEWDGNMIVPMPE